LRDFSSRPQTDWMNMTPSDWMSMAPSDWMDRTFSGWWSRSPADLMRTTPSDWLAAMFGPGTPMGMWSPPRPTDRPDHRGHGRHGEREHHGHRHHHYHHHERCCRRCGADPCECYCCIGDVDLAIYSRLGEQRVIPIIVENERHRDKQITLELSDWTTRGGKAAPLKTVLLEPKAFPLAACGEKKVTLVVSVGGDDLQNATGSTTERSSESDRTALPDVDECLVAVADLRVVGCDHRPICIAVAILPRNCDPYTVTCGCTCC
jgi:hypothetical protein